MTVQEIIKNKPYLAWYVKNPKELSEEATLEHVLNYGSWDDVLQFFKIAGINKSADLFSKTLTKNRINYRPKIENYFKLYFQKHAQKSFK